MEKTAIATRQIFFLITPLIVIPGHFFLIKIFLGWAGRDTWLGMILGFIPGIAIFLALAYLSEKLSGKTIVEWSMEKLGPFFGRIATLPLIVFFIIHSCVTLYGYAIFITAVFLPQHQLWLIAVIFALCVCFTVHLGIEVIARVAEWIIILNILSGTFVSVALSPQKDYKKLLPILENGIDPIIPVALVILALFGEMIVLLMINVERSVPNAVSFRKVYILSFIGNLIIFPSTATGAISIFGVDQAAKFMYPVESMVRLIDVGFIERFDIYGLTIMSVSAYLRLAILHYGSSVAVANWFKLKHYHSVNWILGALVVYLALIKFDTAISFYDFMEKYYLYGLVFSVVILILVLIVFIATKASNKQQEQPAGPKQLENN